MQPAGSWFRKNSSESILPPGATSSPRAMIRPRCRRYGGPVIEVSGLRTQLGDLVAVAQVSFTARPGEIFGLLGPNGAGKTTTLSCISGLLRPSSGRITILGHDVVNDGPAARQSLGVVPQEIALYEELSAAQNLAYWGGV